MIESVIRNRANDIRQSFDIGIPVNVDQICSDLGIKLYEREIRAEAYLICNQGKTSIVTRKKAYKYRKKFSIAHELGHFFLPGHSEHMVGCSSADIGPTVYSGV